ncbi:NinB/ Orf homologous recombination mediator [Polaribacter phage Freya_1]|uniref:DUF1367 family protein n=2 Tax=Freyavirus TaxID=2948713 RepID=A0A8E4ZJJ3_9CAUD|nr:NinB/ Orf homologous recombination mediator [Polaribacter phage Danklef_1]YP_010356736.1 NinB/ Orf homologous recombination mediator [Polaribacter phage Freya_1]QQV90592.1 protein of unknown function DUF1367 [Polaribacter phage Danklef_2]QQV90669.1 protein of unknown function DUF1367 [Polaribacter phage Danklef_3]QQV90745.1 protein of unknown function DUF1367 [Polaribacter phage Danklef_4]QQV90823.1 protein of unknown function DUF1367 [Polaribacter phage Danklef_5]QQV90984.1 protein of unk
MKITLVKNLNNTFSIAYNSDYEKSKKLKAGVHFECEIKKKRNYEFHKKYFALINMLFDNQERYNNVDDLREDLTIEAGFYTKRENIKGESIKKADSVSFASMDEFKFNELYNKTLDVIVKYFNFNKQDIIDNVEQYF